MKVTSFLACVEFGITQRLIFPYHFAGQLAEYEKLKAVAQQVVDMVDPSEEGAPSMKSLVEHLQEAL